MVAKEYKMICEEVQGERGNVEERSAEERSVDERRKTG